MNIIILQGVMEKKDEWYKSYQKRYLILGHDVLWSSDVCTLSSTECDKIDLRDIQSMSKSDDGKFEIVFSSRKWYLKCGSKEREKWMDAIQEQCRIIKQNVCSIPSLAYYKISLQIA